MSAITYKRRQQGRAALGLLALVLGLIMALLGVLDSSWGSQARQRRGMQTHQDKVSSRQALLAFAAWHGRLPCPASQPGGVEDCVAPSAHWLPAANLGLATAGSQVLHYARSPRLAVGESNQAPSLQAAQLCRTLTDLGEADAIRLEHLSPLPNLDSISGSNLAEALGCRMALNAVEAMARVEPSGDWAAKRRADSIRDVDLWRPMRIGNLYKASSDTVSDLGNLLNETDVMSQSLAYWSTCLVCLNFPTAVDTEASAMALSTQSVVLSIAGLAAHVNVLAGAEVMRAQIEAQTLWTQTRRDSFRSLSTQMGLQ